MANYWAIIPAAGSGHRCESHKPKQYLPLADKTVIEYALAPLLAHPLIKKVIVVLAQDDLYWSFLPLATHSKIETVFGGAQRCHSVFNGLKALANVAADDDWILVHDAARPLLQLSDVEKLITTLADHPVGGVLGIPIHATLKKVIDHQVEATVPRTDLWQALTPQLFRYGLLFNALQQMIARDILPSDEAQAIEQLGKKPQMVQGESDNLKLTYPSDFILAKGCLQFARLS